MALATMRAYKSQLRSTSDRIRQLEVAMAQMEAANAAERAAGDEAQNRLASQLEKARADASLSEAKAREAERVAEKAEAAARAAKERSSQPARGLGVAGDGSRTPPAEQPMAAFMGAEAGWQARVAG